MPNEQELDAIIVITPSAAAGNEISGGNCYQSARHPDANEGHSAS